MKKVDSFIFRSFLGPLAMTFFIVLVIFILQFLWMYVDDLAGKGLPLMVLGELLFQFSLTFVPISLPLAILLASLMTFGNMGEFMELTALKASGVSLKRIMLPVFIFVSFLAVASFFFADYILPISNQKARTLLYDIKRKRPELNIQAGTFFDGIDGFSIKITHKDPETNRLDKLFIYDHRQGKGNTSVICADSGYMRVTPDESAIVLTLYNGYSYTEMNEKSSQSQQKNYPFRRDSFKEQTLNIGLTGFDLKRSDDDLFKSNHAMQNSHQLSHSIDSLDKRYEQRSTSYYKDFSKAKVYSLLSQTYTRKKKSSADTTEVISPFTPGSIFDTLSLRNKSTVINSALASAREAASFAVDKSEALITEKKNLTKFRTEFYKKFSLAIACIVFFFIGAPLGAIIRKGGLGTPAVISVLFFVIYYIISITGEKFARELMISVPLGVFASTLILFPIGIFLTYKATTDSSLMNTETYTILLRKIASRFKGSGRAKKDENSHTDN